MNPEQLLEQLAPLRTPEAIGLLPLAAGWWAVIALLAMVLGTLLYFGLRRYQRAAYRRAAVQWLIELEADSADVQMLSRALKTTALKAYAPNTVAGLSGDDWPNFLRQTCSKLDADALTILSQVHRAEPELPKAIDWYHARLWMKHHEVASA